MIDEAIVIDVHNGLARIKVSPQAACCKCSARTLCQGSTGKDGMMTALNPLRARPGSMVRVEIPESGYNREAIRIFGLLLASILVGLGLGSLASSIFQTPPSVSGIVGVGLGLAVGGLGIFLSSRRGRRQPLYPVIQEVISKGAGHEPT
jgi:positive regulator of sigma E activity